MGYSSWNHGGGSFPREANALAAADALVTRGLQKVGYQYVMAFDGWWCTTEHGKRDARGHLVPDPDRWPHGIQSVSDYIHGKGLKVAGYSDVGSIGYGDQDGDQLGGYPYYRQDADQFAAWGWDYIKIDDDDIDGPVPRQKAFTEFCQAVRHNQARRPIFVSLSTPQTPEVANFGRPIANMWRTSGDICVPGSATFSRACGNFDAADDYWWNQAPGTWNDIDMMVVGMKGISLLQSKTLMSMWAIHGAPLIIGCDPVTAPQEIIDILSNREVIAIDQDPLCAQGRKVREDSPGVQVYSKPLGRFTRGDRAVLLLNRSDKAADLKVSWTDLGLEPGSYAVRDLVLHQDLGERQDGLVIPQLAPDDSMLLKVTGHYDWSKPLSYEAASARNRLGGKVQFRAFAGGFASNAIVIGIGGGAGNDLQFNEVEAAADGDYRMTLSYAAQPLDSEVRVSVNHGPPTTLTLPLQPGSPRTATVQQTVHLLKGFNTIRLFHETQEVPAIDQLIIQPMAN